MNANTNTVNPVNHVNPAKSAKKAMKKAQEAAHKAALKAIKAANKAKYKKAGFFGRRVIDLENMVHEHPVLAIGASLAVGAIIANQLNNTSGTTVNLTAPRYAE